MSEPSLPVSGPPGYGQTSAVTQGGKTALLTILALMIGIGGGVVAAWPMSSGGAGEAPGHRSVELETTDYASVEYETETLCEYTAVVLTTSEDELVDFSEPQIWRIYAIANLANAVSSSESPTGDYKDYRGTDLMYAIGKHRPENITDELETLQEYCVSRN